MSNIPQKLSEFLETLSMFSDESQRINLLISYVDKFKAVTEEIAQRPYSDENKVPFCESGAYVWVKKNTDGTLKFYFAVENPQGISAKALAVILDKTLSGEKPEALLREGGSGPGQYRALGDSGRLSPTFFPGPCRDPASARAPIRKG